MKFGNVAKLIIPALFVALVSVHTEAKAGALTYDGFILYENGKRITDNLFVSDGGVYSGNGIWDIVQYSVNVNEMWEVSQYHVKPVILYKTQDKIMSTKEWKELREKVCNEENAANATPEDIKTAADIGIDQDVCNNYGKWYKGIEKYSKKLKENAEYSVLILPPPMYYPKNLADPVDPRYEDLSLGGEMHRIFKLNLERIPTSDGKEYVMPQYRDITIELVKLLEAGFSEEELQETIDSNDFYAPLLQTEEKLDFPACAVSPPKTTRAVLPITTGLTGIMLGALMLFVFRKGTKKA